MIADAARFERLVSAVDPRTGGGLRGYDVRILVLEGEERDIAQLPWPGKAVARGLIRSRPDGV